MLLDRLIPKYKVMNRPYNFLPACRSMILLILINFEG